MSKCLGVIMVAALLVSGTALADQDGKPATRAEATAKRAEGKQAKAPPVVEEPVVEEVAADEPAGEPSEPGAEEAQIPHVPGPKLVDLGHEIEIDLPEGFVLFERAQAQEMARQGGNDADYVLGAVVKPSGEWLVFIEYSDIGYVSDSDADELDADELLESYREGTAQQNVKRKELGVPELFIDGWSEKPRYELVKRQLRWGLNGHDSDGPVVNYFTRVLGRGGFISINLITAPQQLEQARTEAAPVVGAIRYRAGARYEDYREGDKSSGLGLTALVLGGAGVAKAAKAGVLIAILAFFKKGFVLLLVPFAALGKWLLGRKKKDEPPAESPPDTSAT